MTRLLTILCILLVTDSLSAQTMVYDIVLFGNTIGTATVERSLQGRRAEYRMMSSAETTVMFKTHTSSADIRLVFEDDVLHEGTVVRERDGERTDVSITRQGKRYTVLRNGERVEQDEAIDLVSTQFFFEEPAGQQRVYVEKLGEWVDIEPQGDGVYITHVDGARNTYHYQAGRMVELEMKKGVRIYMRLRQG